jgi:predicted ATPase
MLCHLHISNFAIVRALEIDWASGMSTITGETGAGKSIAIDALIKPILLRPLISLPCRQRVNFCSSRIY